VANLIKALMVDVDGVLVTGRPSDGRHWAVGLKADLGLNFDDLQTRFFKPHWEEIVTGRASLRTRLVEVLGEIAPGLAVEQLLAYWFSQDARLNADLLNELAALRRRGFLVCLATNQEHERMHYLMHSVGFAAQFDSCYCSADIGHRKPAREFFDAVVMKVRLSPGELLLIDDAAENVRAALAAGWHAVHWTVRERICDLLGQDLPIERF
jgi:putative hydrolase of the HAD superfamily